MFKKCATSSFRPVGWTVEYDDMNATFEVQDQSLDWLDSLSHLLEYFAYTFRRLNDRIEPKER
ncbi:MAG: hypothetical protein ACJZ87_06350 [Paracoccaceae bacterium]